MPHVFNNREAADKFCRMAGRAVSNPRRIIIETVDDALESSNEIFNCEARL